MGFDVVWDCSIFSKIRCLSLCMKRHLLPERRLWEEAQLTHCPQTVPKLCQEILRTPVSCQMVRLKISEVKSLWEMLSHSFSQKKCETLKRLRC